ncbi:MAG: sugar ABC transporter permease [Chloroflexota bacterium]|nr:sugar ABC transporter permease [Chloroflexota bacterium]
MSVNWQNMSFRDRREALQGYLSISPWVIGFLLFTLGPVLVSVYFSLTQWTITSPAEWVGLHNYIRMFTNDPLFWQALKVTGNFVLISVPLKLIFGVALSLLLNLKVRGMNVYRTIFYIPAVISGVAVSLMWIWLLQPDTGVINTLLALVGIKGPGWFWDPQWALFSVALMSVWSVGGSAIIYLAGLQNIPPHLYEAARIDGAGAWQRFWRITIPLLTPTLFFQLLVEMIESFKVFTQAFVITKGGPLKATYFYLFYFYEEAFQNFNMGYASALAVVLMVIIMTATIILNHTSKHWVYYAAEREEAK